MYFSRRTHHHNNLSWCWISSFEEKLYNEIFKYFFECHGLPILFPPSLMMMGFCSGEQFNLFKVVEMDLDINDIVSTKCYQYQNEKYQFEEVPKKLLKTEPWVNLEDRYGDDSVKTFCCKKHKRAYRISIYQKSLTQKEVAVRRKQVEEEDEEEMNMNS